MRNTLAIPGRESVVAGLKCFGDGYGCPMNTVLHSGENTVPKNVSK